MPELILTLEGEDAFPEVKPHQRLIHIGEGGQPIRVAVLNRGMGSGRPSVAIRLETRNGTVIIAETSARLFALAGRLIATKYPDLFEGP